VDAKSRVGNYTCGLVRNAVAAELLANNVNFADTDFLRSLPDYINNNPSVAGFMIEQAVLLSIKSNGLAIGADISKPMKLVVFTGVIPRFHLDITGKPVLYCPDKFNFPGIDAHVEPQRSQKRNQKQPAKRTLFMYLIQITLSSVRHLILI